MTESNVTERHISGAQIKLAIISPIYGGYVRAEHQSMMLTLGNILGGSPERFALAAIGFVDRNPVDHARNECVEKAIAAGANWLLMIDADTWIIDEGTDDAGFQLATMISDADRAGATIVIAPVRRRGVGGEDHGLMVYDGGRPWATRPAAGAQEGLVEIDEGATAVMAINLTKIDIDKSFRFEFTSERSEDREFCRRVKAAGGKVFVDTRVRTAHLSRPVVLHSKVRREA